MLKELYGMAENMFSFAAIRLSLKSKRECALALLDSMRKSIAKNTNVHSHGQNVTNLPGAMACFFQEFG